MSSLIITLILTSSLASLASMSTFITQFARGPVDLIADLDEYRAQSPDAIKEFEYACDHFFYKITNPEHLAFLQEHHFIAPHKQKPSLKMRFYFKTARLFVKQVANWANHEMQELTPEL